MGFFRKLFRRNKRKDTEGATVRRSRFKFKTPPRRDDSPTQPVVEEKQEIPEFPQENNVTVSRSISPNSSLNGKFKSRGPDLSDGTQRPAQRPVLSPHNFVSENLVNPQHVVSPRSPRSPRSTGPVDLDEVSDSAPEEDEPEPAKPMFTMPDHSPRFSAGNVEVDSDDGDGSSLMYSTDTDQVEDYGDARRRLGAGLPPKDESAAFNSSNSIVTTYTTDGEGSVFPLLNSEDDRTTETPSTSISKEAERNPLLNLPTVDPKTGQTIQGAVNPVTGQSLGMHPVSGQSLMTGSTLPTNTKDLFGAKKEQIRDKFKLATPKRDSPERTPRRPIGFNSPFMGALYAKSQFPSPEKSSKKSRQPDFDPFASEGAFGGGDKTFKGSKFDGADGFEEFADWNNAFRTNNAESSHSFENHPAFVEKKESSNKRAESSVSKQRSSRSVAHEDNSLSKLLEEAKMKKPGRKASNSVSSAPAISAEYLRRTHNLGSRGSSERDTSVTDIIQSLEAASASRHSTSTRSLGSRHHRTASHGDDQLSHHSRSSVRSRERLRRRRERRNKKEGEFSSDSEEENEVSENWLFDEVTGALGPKGIAADLESLSGRSNRSASSRGGRSHKSHRSHRSSRSKRRSSRKQGSGDSVDSHHSRESRRSRSSRYSTRSYISQMSEQSRSVANDLRRLEMQLAMVGGGAGDGGSVRSRVSRTRSRSSSARRSRTTVTAPPGKLGIILANKADSKGTVVSGVRTSSVLADRVAPGDRIVAIDGEDVSLMTVSEITTIMARKADFDRTLTILTTPRTDESGDSYRYRR